MIIHSGKAASAFGGCTLHSSNGGLCLQVTKKGETGCYIKLRSKVLKDFQNMFKGLKLVIIDEFSMLCQYNLYHIDMRLREICACNLPFGGVTVVLFGDPGQIPPVQTSPLWNELFMEGKRGENDQFGFKSYSLFQTVTLLVENQRVDFSLQSSMFFHGFLQRMRSGSNTYDDWLKVNDICSKQMIGNEKWDSEGYSSNNATYLFTTNRVSFVCFY